MYKRLIINILVLVSCGNVWAADTIADSTESDIIGWRLGLVGGVTVGAFLVGHVYLNDLWWKGEPTDFHINTTTDYTYALGADKLGHMTFSYATATVYGDLFRWCGMDSVAAIWSGAGVSTAYQTYIEIRDGFSADYGFSWGDIAANTIGASLPVIKHYVPVLRPLELQVSFWPSDAYKNGEYGAIIDDYSSTTHWLAITPYDWMPPSWQEFYPAWLGFAIGHSVENLDGKGAGNHIAYLSFDWNLARITGLPDWLSSVFRVLHLYHLPAPAVKVYPNVVWYGLRF